MEIKAQFGDVGPENRIAEYWHWVGVALFLLLTVDLLTSLYAGAVVGVEHEANPLMQWLLTQPLWLIAAVHIAVGVAVAGLFKLLFVTIERADEPFDTMLGWFVEVFLGLFITVGLFVFANNLFVIVFQESLL